MKTGRAAVALAFTVALAACSGPGPDALSPTLTDQPRASASELDSPQHADWAERLSYVLGDDSAEIDDASRDVLRPSLETGVVTAGQVAMAAVLTVHCVELAGLGISLTAPSSPFSGYEVELFFNTGGSEDPELAERLGLVGEACLERNLFVVEAMYLTQPESIEAQEAAEAARFEEFKGALTACLTDAGASVDPDVTYAEMSELLAIDLEARAAEGCAFTTGYVG